MGSGCQKVQTNEERRPTMRLFDFSRPNPSKIAVRTDLRVQTKFPTTFLGFFSQIPDPCRILETFTLRLFENCI